MMMRLSTSQLEAFVAVARTRNFTRAAQSVHLTQSALSQRIQALEETLSITLLIRDRAGARLTDAGEKLLRYCQAQSGLEDEMLSELSAPLTQARGGIVRVGAFSSVARSLALPALAHIARARPEVRVELLIRELSELPGLLKRAEVDYVITAATLGRDDVQSVHLGDEYNVLVRPKGYRESKSEPEWFLDHHENDEVTGHYLRKYRSTRESREAMRRRRYLDEVYGLLDGVRLGLGSAVLPLHLVRNEPGIQIVNRDRAWETPVWLHYWEQPYFSKLHGEVVAALQAEAGVVLKV